MWTIRTMRASRPVVQKSQTLRSIVLGGLIGVVVSGGLALPTILPPAMAQDEPMRTIVETMEPRETPKVIDGEAFVKPDWTMADGDVVEPWVSTDAISYSTVRKVSFGRTEFVQIATTSTGVYSSDALESAHVRYPGIHDGQSDGAAIGTIEIWDGGWKIIRPLSAGSFVSVLPFKGGRLLMLDGNVCVRTRYGLSC